MGSILDDFVTQGKSKSCPVIDMHTHMGPFQGVYMPNESPEAMLRTMDRCGVKMAISSSHAALVDTQENTRMAEIVGRYRDRFRAYWVVNPNYPERMERELSLFSRAEGFVGFKFLSDYHKYPLSGPRYKPALRHADRHGLLILMHTWGKSPYDSPALVEELVGEYPGATFLMGHSGYGEWEKSIEVAHDHKNAYLELTAAYAVNGVIEWMVKEAGPRKVVFGTDLPWFDPHYGIGCVIFSRIEDDDRHSILHVNAERILKAFV